MSHSPSKGYIAFMFSMMAMAPIWQGFVAWCLWDWFMDSSVSWGQCIGIVLMVRVVFVLRGHAELERLHQHYSLRQYIRATYRKLLDIDGRLINKSVEDEPLGERGLNERLEQGRDLADERHEQAVHYLFDYFAFPVVALGIGFAIHWLT